MNGRHFPGTFGNALGESIKDEMLVSASAQTAPAKTETLSEISKGFQADMAKWRALADQTMADANRYLKYQADGSSSSFLNQGTDGLYTTPLRDTSLANAASVDGLVGQSSATAVRYYVDAKDYGGRLESIARGQLSDQLGRVPTQREVNNYVGQLSEINSIGDPRAIPADMRIYLPDANTPAATTGLGVYGRDIAYGERLKQQEAAKDRAYWDSLQVGAWSNRTNQIVEPASTVDLDLMKARVWAAEGSALTGAASMVGDWVDRGAAILGNGYSQSSANNLQFVNWLGNASDNLSTSYNRYSAESALLEGQNYLMLGQSAKDSFTSFSQYSANSEFELGQNNLMMGQSFSNSADKWLTNYAAHGAYMWTDTDGGCTPGPLSYQFVSDASFYLNTSTMPFNLPLGSLDGKWIDKINSKLEPFSGPMKGLALVTSATSIINDWRASDESLAQENLTGSQHRWLNTAFNLVGAVGSATNSTPIGVLCTALSTEYTIIDRFYPGGVGAYMSYGAEVEQYSVCLH
ncbi:hypothetical protein [Holophaga foetida]|uniref:hypothetical protein n=1 Tax=Holophaga foetida TaxID=35839 RepID=UPI00047A8EF0|nr:hypothetical protein [Holophaga foetida]